MFVLTDCMTPTGRGNDTRRVSVYVEQGRIAEVAGGADRVRGGYEVVDCGGLLLLPGAIDAHVHFDTPGFTHREDFDHGTAAAAAGGVTTVIDMPCTSLPPVTNARALAAKLAVVGPMARVDYAMWGGASGNLLADPSWRTALADLAGAGVVGFKAYLLSGMETFTELSLDEVALVTAHAASMGMVVAIHAEDPGLVRERTAAALAAGRMDWDAVADVRADPVEERGVETGLAIARRTGCALHVVHVGSAAAAAQVAAARRDGVDVTAETCPHFLAFTRDDFATRGAFLKTAPVVKTTADRDALWDALANGAIDYVATDHAPCPVEEKTGPRVWDAYGGVPGVETMLPFLLSEGVARGRLTPARLVEIAAGAQARRWGLSDRKGSIEVGKDADFALVDPGAEWTVRGEDLHGKARWTPFENTTFRGKVIRTFVRGRLVYDAAVGVVGDPGWGRYLPRAGARSR